MTIDITMDSSNKCDGIENTRLGIILFTYYMLWYKI